MDYRTKNGYDESDQLLKEIPDDASIVPFYL